MAYEKHEWVNNETITASKLNNIEDGIEEAAQSGGGGAVIIIDDGTNLDKTFAEIYELLKAGTPCYVRFGFYAEEPLDTEYDYGALLMPVICAAGYDSAYRIYVSTATSQWGENGMLGASGVWTYSADTINDYPEFYRRSIARTDAVNVINSRGI